MGTHTHKKTINMIFLILLISFFIQHIVCVDSKTCAATNCKDCVEASTTSIQCHWCAELKSCHSQSKLTKEFSTEKRAAPFNCPSLSTEPPETTTAATTRGTFKPVKTFDSIATRDNTLVTDVAHSRIDNPVTGPVTGIADPDTAAADPGQAEMFAMPSNKRKREVACSSSDCCVSTEAAFTPFPPATRGSPSTQSTKDSFIANAANIDDTSSTKESNNIGLIIGASVGGALCCAALIIGALLYSKKDKPKSNSIKDRPAAALPPEAQ